MRTTFAMAILAAVLVAPAAALASDVRGSSDYPLFGRLAGTRIADYSTSNYEEFFVPLGAWSGAEPAKSYTAKGKMTFIMYERSPEASRAEVLANFATKMREAGFTIDFQCEETFNRRNTCGSPGGALNLKRRMVVTNDYFDIGYYSYLAAHLNRPEGNIWVAMIAGDRIGNGWAYHQLVIIEEKGVDIRMVDASTIAKEMAQSGRISLYGILFDTGKADIRPDSKAALDEIAKYLRSNPNTRIAVVGHTDNQGGLDYNMDLSKRRAQAVVNSLVRDHGIQTNRLTHWGAGFLAPVASNRTEEGRAKNRRVDLVEQ